MLIDWEEVVPTKGALGVGYLAGAGLALSLSLLGYIWFTRESVTVLFIGTFVALALFAMIIYVGYMFLHDDFSAQFVWDVAQWTSLGLGVTALFSLGITASQRYLPAKTLVPSLLVITIATGGVIGTLAGVVSGLRSQHREIQTITQRNKVMNRVLRHNIKNAMNIVLGQALILADRRGIKDDPAINAIERTVEEVVSLSEAARKIDTLDTASDSGPIDMVEIVEQYAEVAQGAYPEAQFSVELPDEAWADADPIIRSALSNLVENAVEHNDRSPEIQISVADKHESVGSVEICVADNGPGIPDNQIDILFEEQEGPTSHGNGLGLWLVKWVVETYDGTLRFEENNPRGSVICMQLPAVGAPSNRQ